MTTKRKTHGQRKPILARSTGRKAKAAPFHRQPNRIEVLHKLASIPFFVGSVQLSSMPALDKVVLHLFVRVAVAITPQIQNRRQILGYALTTNERNAMPTSRSNQSYCYCSETLQKAGHMTSKMPLKPTAVVLQSPGVSSYRIDFNPPERPKARAR